MEFSAEFDVGGRVVEDACVDDGEVPESRQRMGPAPKGGIRKYFHHCVAISGNAFQFM